MKIKRNSFWLKFYRSYHGRSGQIKRFEINQIAKWDEAVVVVSVRNERSKMGRFVVDRQKYPAFHKPAKDIPTQIWVDEYLGNNTTDLSDYLHRFSNMNKGRNELLALLKNT